MAVIYVYINIGSHYLCRTLLCLLTVSLRFSESLSHHLWFWFTLTAFIRVFLAAGNFFQQNGLLIKTLFASSTKHQLSVWFKKWIALPYNQYTLLERTYYKVGQVVQIINHCVFSWTNVKLYFIWINGEFYRAVKSWLLKLQLTCIWFSYNCTELPCCFFVPTSPLRMMVFGVLAWCVAEADPDWIVWLRSMGLFSVQPVNRNEFSD